MQVGEKDGPARFRIRVQDMKTRKVKLISVKENDTMKHLVTDIQNFLSRRYKRSTRGVCPKCNKPLRMTVAPYARGYTDYCKCK